MKIPFVVIGGGIAGITTAETLAYLNPEKRILLVSKSKLIKSITDLIPVSKMLYNFNVQEKTANSLTETYPNITIIHDVLMYINSTNKIINLESGADIQYEYLCLCMGGVPKLIPGGKDNPYVLGIRDTDSVVHLQKRVHNARRLIIVGNGGIASELVHEIKNIEVFWIVKDNHISSTFVDPGAAEFFQNKLTNITAVESKTYIRRLRYAEADTTANSGAALGPDWQKNFNITGVENSTRTVCVEYNSEIQQIVLNKSELWPLTVYLTNDKKIECDLIVSATGVCPLSDISIDENFVLAQDGGIAVNDKMETSVPSVYAAGDICTASWPISKHWFQMRLWGQARQMGMYTARSVTSHLKNEPIIQDFCFEMFAHATNLFGYKVALLGLYNGQKLDNNYECLVRVTPNLEYIKLVIVDGRIQGAVLVGDTGLEETIENLILNQLDVTPYGEDLLNPDIDIEDYFD